MAAVRSFVRIVTVLIALLIIPAPEIPLHPLPPRNDHYQKIAIFHTFLLSSCECCQNMQRVISECKGVYGGDCLGVDLQA